MKLNKILLFVAFGLCFKSYGTSVLLGITSPGETGLGIMGHAFIVITRTNESLFSSDVYSYGAQYDEGENMLKVVGEALSGQRNLHMSHWSLQQFLNSATYSEGRSVYLFEVKLDKEQKRKVIYFLENDLQDHRLNNLPKYSMSNTCWTRVLEAINISLPEEQKIQLSDHSFWENILWDFQDPRKRAESLINYSPYYFIPKLRENRDIFRELPTFHGANKRLISLTSSFLNFISIQNDKGCILNSNVKQLLKDYFMDSIYKGNYISAASVINKIALECEADEGKETMELKSEFLKLMKVVNVRNYDDFYNLINVGK